MRRFGAPLLPFLTPFSDHTSALHNNGTFIRLLGVISGAFWHHMGSQLAACKKKKRNMHLDFVALSYCSVCLEKKQQYKKTNNSFFFRSS